MREERRNGYEQREAVRKQKRREEKQEMSRKERRAANREDRKKAKKKRKAPSISTIILIAIMLVGAGICVEKAFQSGGQRIRDMGIRVESLARIKSMSEENGIEFCE